VAFNGHPCRVHKCPLLGTREHRAYVHSFPYSFTRSCSLATSFEIIRLSSAASRAGSLHREQQSSQLSSRAKCNHVVTAATGRHFNTVREGCFRVSRLHRSARRYALDQSSVARRLAPAEGFEPQPAKTRQLAPTYSAAVAANALQNDMYNPSAGPGMRRLHFYQEGLNPCAKRYFPSR
jgi:hypothetical protein